MRLCAQAVGRVHLKHTGKRGEFSQEERSYFNKVFIEIIIQSWSSYLQSHIRKDFKTHDPANINSQ